MDKADRTLDGMLALGAVVVLGISFYFTTGSLPQVEVCSFKRVLGVPCPGCGLTRAFCSISHGQFGNAWNFNPFAYVFYSIAVYMVLRPLLKLKFPKMERWFVNSRWSTILPIALIIGMLVFGALRIIFAPNSA